MKKIAVICLALVLALGGLGVAYAAWTDTVEISGPVTAGEVSWEFDDPLNPGTPRITDDDHGPDPVAPPGSNEEGKDVAWKEFNFVDSDADGDKDVLEITVHNAYPWYTNHMSFWLHNNGTIPIKLDYVVISGGGESYTLTSPGGVLTFDLNQNGVDDFKIYWGDSFGVQTEPCEYYDISFSILFLQDNGLPSIQGQEGLTFTIEIYCIQWNEY
jgi:predicted ribosomally synthesized peptide with SipW-like signal peptide